MRVCSAGRGVSHLLLGFLAVASSQPAAAWKPYTHNVTAEAARADLCDDWQVTIAGREYLVREEVARAICDRRENDMGRVVYDGRLFYNAGVVGPDGFPDLTYGQSVIHPGPVEPDEGKAALTADWLRHVLKRAWDAQSDDDYDEQERKKILAFAYGFLTHAAGDLWGHTFINDFAAGIFPDRKSVV